MFVSKKAAIAAVCFTAALAIGSQAVAKPHPYSVEFERQAQSLFFEGGQVSPAKIDQYIKRLQLKRGEVKSLLIGEQRMKGKTNLSKMDAKAESESILGAFDVAIKNLQDAKSSRDQGQVYTLIANALDLEGAVRIEGNQDAFSKVAARVSSFSGKWVLPKVSPAEDEATNLYNHATGRYLSVQEIADLKARNVDLSMYSPAGTGTFWQPQANISKVDVHAAAVGKTIDIYSDFPGFPADNVYTFDKVKQSDTKPKMDVTFIDARGQKQKMKLKIGAEIHADPTVAALMMTMGFPADMTKYARNIKVVLGKTKISDLKRDWEAFYKRDNKFRAYKIEDYIQESGVDSKGQNFVVFKEGLLEAKPAGVARIGGWKFSDNSHNSLREVRALMMVQLWLDNNDVKEFTNNQLLLRRYSNGEARSRLIISDLGHSLGGMFLEAPDLYSPRMVVSETSNAFTFGFRSMQPASIKNQATLADARWAARLIGSLTREQITAAVQIAGWPACIQTTYVEKMISRRNDLVQKLGLASAVGIMPVTVQNAQSLALNKTCGKAELAEEFTTKFDLGLETVLKPIGGTIASVFMQGAQAAINADHKVKIKGSEFGFATQEIVEVYLNFPKRHIERNPSPTSEQDMYIVRDQFELGFRLGVSYGAYTDVIYKRNYTLAYPVRTMAEGQTSNGFLGNVLLPIHIHTKNLPESYVVKTEHYLENGVGVDFDKKIGLVSPVVRAGVARINLWRSIFDHRDSSRYVLYRDRSHFTEASLALLARVAVVKIPVFKTLAGWGRAVGRGTVITKEEMANPDRAQVIAKAVADGDFTALQSQEREFELTNDFSYSRKKWNLLIWKGSREKRLDQIEMTSSGSSKNTIRFSSSKTSDGGFLSTRETKSASVDVFVDPLQPKKFRLSVGVVEVDEVTTDKELTKYLGYMNGLSMDGSKVINFTPANGYSTNGVWGAMVAKSDTEFSPAALDRILSMSEPMFWSQLAAAARMSVSDMANVKRRYEEFIKARRQERSSLVNDRMIMESFELTSDQAEMVREGKAFLKRLASAKKENRLEKKIQVLAEAFRKALYTNSARFYEPCIISAMMRVSGVNNVYSRNVISKPLFSEMNTIESAPMYGEVGQPLGGELKHLVFSPQSPVELYTMFDSWF